MALSGKKGDDMDTYVQTLDTKGNLGISDIGGKGANLVALAEIEGIPVPEGFCITTTAYREIAGRTPELDTLLEQLSLLKTTELDNIRHISEKIRKLIESITIPGEILFEITEFLEKHGIDSAYAVRSSATAEDLPSASFAGQHDTYLNISGKTSLLEHIRKCWASLFSDRAVIYRIQNGFSHRKVSIAVIVQHMISPEISGIMFTADPVTGNRRIISIDAGYGIGEALVSGLVSPDVYRVKGEDIVEKKISNKNKALFAVSDGGIGAREIKKELTGTQALSDDQIRELAVLGRKIEAFFDCPQDIEWCLVDNKFYFVQSRPITTLYPLAEDRDGRIHIFMSSGHMQMMTDPIKPLGMSFYQSVLGNPPSQEIGGRLYVDMTHDLASPFGRLIAKSFVGMVGDDLITSSIGKAIRNRELIKSLPKGKNRVIKPESSSGALSIMRNAYRIFKLNDPDIIKRLIAEEDDSIRRMEEEIRQLSGDEVFEYILKDHENRRMKVATPERAGALTAVLLSEKWFNRKVKKWLGIKNAADSFLMSIPNSITTETGFALLDVADTIRGNDEIIEYLKNPGDETFFDDIARFDGGKIFSDSFQKFLTEYGMRCSGDIDITVPRWSEKPSSIAPVILSNIRNYGPDASKLKFEQGIEESERRIEEIALKVEKLRGGRKKAEKVRRIARLIRNYIGYREYPKFSYIKRYDIYKQALLKEASELLRKGIIRYLEDVYFLSFDEFRTVAEKGILDYQIIEERRRNYKDYEKMTPPRVMTSEGEIITGEYDKGDMPRNALPGLAVSAGIVEGRARIVSSFDEADLDKGDILVTEFTDPSWTPLFVSINALVTEVGGLITHGAIIAREYGLPAVVSVEGATRLIKDGQMIRVNGTEGYVEVLE